MSGWRYYNHAMLPSAAPHELPELRPLKDGSVWKLSGGVHLYLQDGPRILIVDMRQNGGM